MKPINKYLVNRKLTNLEKQNNVKIDSIQDVPFNGYFIAHHNDGGWVIGKKSNVRQYDNYKLSFDIRKCSSIISVYINSSWPSTTLDDWSLSNINNDEYDMCLQVEQFLEANNIKATGGEKCEKIGNFVDGKFIEENNI